VDSARRRPLADVSPRGRLTRKLSNYKEISLNTPTIRPFRARRLMTSAVAATVLLGATPAAVVIFGAAASGPATISGDRIELVNTIRAPLPLLPPTDDGDGPTPAPIPGGPGATSKKKFDEYGYYQCIQDHRQDAQSCCIIHDGKWIPDDNNPHNPGGTCRAARTMGDPLPGMPGLPTEAVDVGSPRTPPGFPTEAADPGSPQSPPVTTVPPVVRDHRTP
jgi:hypothetical protein